jgi:hypothetical protein
MMKRILVALALLVGSVASAAAACTSPAVMHDFPGSVFNMSLGTNPIDANCSQSVMAQGMSASGSALAGNPVRAGLSDGTNTQNWLAAIALADGVNGNNTGAMAPWLWNGTSYDRWYGDKTNGAWVNVKNANANGPAAPASASPVTPSNQPVGAATIATNQVSVDTTVGGKLIVAQRAGVAGTGRVSVDICNTSTTDVWLGPSGVTVSNGHLLVGIKGACTTLKTTAAVYGIVGSGTETVSFLENY